MKTANFEESHVIIIATICKIYYIEMFAACNRNKKYTTISFNK